MSMSLGALDNVSESVCLIDISGTYLYANRKYIEEYGLKAAPLGKKYYDIVKYGTNSKEALDKRINEIRQNGGTIVYHSVYDDNNRVHQISAFLIDSPQGEARVVFHAGYHRPDKSAQPTQRLNSLFEAILFNIPVYLFVKDVEDDFRYVYWNSAFAQFSKIPTSRAIGHTDFEIFPDRSSRKVPQGRHGGSQPIRAAHRCILCLRHTLTPVERHALCRHASCWCPEMGAAR